MSATNYLHKRTISLMAGNAREHGLDMEMRYTEFHVNDFEVIASVAFCLAQMTGWQIELGNCARTHLRDMGIIE